ncbi:uncharacterized protein DFE_A0018 (plasmid) [Desulfovibrio ferrophilus]|uniref:Uncharacterized protein n=2 Tax=Desulfovibrio ferrophilus TaxID=241368 RepID=A0A2Z6B3M7_9BACT|nr:uncharacterized protein DFE_A0018 [Desulfovibrio ferrophilus]
MRETKVLITEQKVMAQARTDMEPEMQSINVVEDQNGETIEISEWCIKGQLYTRFVQGDTITWEAKYVQRTKVGVLTNSMASVPVKCVPKHQNVTFSKPLSDADIAALQSQPEYKDYCPVEDNDSKE